MKSPYQLEVLEKTYAMESYPSEALRAELSAKIGLSDRHLQMWFCHRRLKDRKVLPTKQQRREESPAAVAAAVAPIPAGERIYRKSQREKRRPTPTPKPMPTLGLIRTLVFLGGALSGTLVETALTARHATEEVSMDTTTLQFFSKL